MSIIEVPLTKDLIMRAWKAYKEQPEYQSTKNLNDKRDFYGYLGQLGVIEWMESKKLYPEHGKYFEESKKGDKCDFIWRGELCDVKTSPVTKEFPYVYKKSRLLLNDETKKVDRLVFAKVNLWDKVLYIAGTVSWYTFYYLAKPLTGENVKDPCHYVLAKDLDDFWDYAFGI
jgi:hypothetical protein